MTTIPENELKALKEMYKVGTTVELDYMDDPYENIPSGTRGVVKSVDDIGTIHVRWDNGKNLGVVFGEDKCHIVEV